MKGFESKRAFRKIINKLNKSNIYAQEAGAEIVIIKHIIAKIKFNIKIILVKKSDK